MDLTTIFCHVDDFCKQYHKQIQKNILPDSEYARSNKGYSMGLSEIISVLVYYGVSSKDFKTFKAFYNTNQIRLHFTAWTKNSIFAIALRA